MDYGQPVSTPKQEPFFTAGAGVASEQNNPYKADSLSSDIYTPQRDPKNLGNAAIASSEQVPSVTEIPLEGRNPAEAVNDQALGQIISLEMPPGVEQPEEAKDLSKDFSFDRATINTTKKISKSGYRAIESATSKLNKDGNASDFYEEIRGEGGLVEANLENSYNRKLAA